MQAITSTVEILLIGNNQVNINLIVSLLTEIESQRFKLTTVQDFDGILAALDQCSPNLIFYIFEQGDESKLRKLQELNTQNMPLILVSTVVGLDLALLTEEIDDCLIWSEITAASLAKTIFLALKRHQNRLETELVSHENIELGSQLLATKNLFQTIIDNTSTLIWMCDANGNSTYFNQAWNRILGQKIEKRLNSNWMMQIHPDDLTKCQQEFELALTETKGFTISYRLENLTNQYLWISNTAVPQFTLGGDFKGLVGYCFDITSIKQSEQQLIRRAASDRLLTQITQKIHASLDLDQILQATVAEVNQVLQAEKIQISRVEPNNQLKLLFESRLSKNYFSCEIDQSPKLPVVLFQTSLTQLAAGQIVIQDNVNSFNITSTSCSSLLIPIISEQKLWGLISVEQCSSVREWTTEEIKLLERVTMELSVAIKQAQLYQELEKANLELAKLSVIDGLTKIANRRKFDQYIAAEWTRLAREQNPLSLILCDIDHFKLYNDTYGHQAGDRCLQKVAQAIEKVVKRPADLVARYGGEEFVIVLPNTPAAGAKYLAQQLLLQIQSLKLPHINSSVDLYVTLSLGIACCIPQPNSNFSALIAAADRGLYQAKATGRNRVVECEIKSE
ncbi:MAG: diguanylate cyclase [Cyanobacteria bacterium P01_E01_bin.35]